jgi:hypothetical protein
MENEKNVVNANADNEGLRPTAADAASDALRDEVEGFVATQEELEYFEHWWVSEKNRAELLAYWESMGMRVVEGFEATREELLVLVKYWERIFRSTRYHMFIWDDYEPDEIMHSRYATARIGRIAKLIGYEAVDKARNEEEAEIAKSQDPVMWKAYLEYDEATRDTLLEKLYDKMATTVSQ